MFVSLKCALRGVLALAAIHTLTASAVAADITWNNPAGGRWGDAANWVGGVLPGVADRAIINLPVTVIVDATRSVASFELANGATLRVVGDAAHSHASLQVSADAINRGTIRLDSATAGYSSQLIVNGGATLTNAPTGVIEFIFGTGSNRYLQGNLRNQGQITAEAAFDGSPGLIILSDGGYAADGGTISGSVYARSKAISMLSSPSSPSTILVAGSDCTLVGATVPGYTVDIVGRSAFSHATCRVPANLTNHATIRLSTADAGYFSQLIVNAGATLTNGSDGTILAAAGASPIRYINGSFVNDGIMHVNAGVLLTTDGYNQSETGALEFQLAGTSPAEFARLSIAGHCSLDGILRVSRVNGFAPVLGDRFQVLTFTSMTDWISCNDVDGLFLGGNLRLNLERNPTNLTLEVVDSAVIPGDPNCNCSVDLEDLANVLSNFGTQSGMTLADGDFDLDGDVDLSDLAFLLSNYGASCQ